MPRIKHKNLLKKPKKTCGLFSHTSLLLINSCIHTYTHSEGMVSPCVSAYVCACMNWHAGQSDVPSHICQHPLFICAVILSIVDLVTWSESVRCGATGTPESPVRMWWETRACDPPHSTTHTYKQKHLHNMTSLLFQISTLPPFTLKSPSQSFSFDFVTLCCPV